MGSKEEFFYWFEPRPGVTPERYRIVADSTEEPVSLLKWIRGFRASGAVSDPPEERFYWKLMAVPLMAFGEFSAQLTDKCASADAHLIGIKELVKASAGDDDDMMILAYAKIETRADWMQRQSKEADERQLEEARRLEEARQSEEVCKRQSEERLRSEEMLRKMTLLTEERLRKTTLFKELEKHSQIDQHKRTLGKNGNFFYWLLQEPGVSPEDCQIEHVVGGKAGAEPSISLLDYMANFEAGKAVPDDAEIKSYWKLMVMPGQVYPKFNEEFTNIQEGDTRLMSVDKLAIVGLPVAAGKGASLPSVPE